jgi:hypothetical protein
MAFSPMLRNFPVKTLPVTAIIGLDTGFFKRFYRRAAAHTALAAANYGFAKPAKLINTAANTVGRNIEGPANMPLVKFRPRTYIYYNGSFFYKRLIINAAAAENAFKKIQHT